MHLIAFVIAGQHIHHDIRTTPQGHFPLAGDGLIEQIEGATLWRCPSGGQIIAGDDQRGDAVAAA